MLHIYAYKLHLFAISYCIHGIYMYICSWNIINLFVHPANYKSLIRKYIYIPPNKWCRFILGLIFEHTTIERCKTKKKLKHIISIEICYKEMLVHTPLCHTTTLLPSYLFIYFFHLHDAQRNSIIQYKVDFIIKSS